MKSLHMGMLIMIAFLGFGCRSQETKYTPNYQALTARTVADTGTTIYAGQAPLSGDDMKELAEWAAELEEFLSNGHLSSVATGSLANTLVAQTPERFQPILETALAHITGRNVDLDAAIGPHLLRLFRNAVHGIRTAAELWEPLNEECE